MPELIRYQEYPVPLSIVEFNPGEGEEIFLSFSKGRWNGPGINRDGVGPPWMVRLYGRPGERTTDPYEQRYRTWFIDEKCKSDEEKEVEDELLDSETQLEKKQTQLASSRGQNRAKLERQINELQEQVGKLDQILEDTRKVRIHDKNFEDLYPTHQIIGQQGCGDLSMNLWKVGYMNSTLSDDEPHLIYLHDEPIWERTYRCLVKYKHPYEVKIEDVKFNPYTEQIEEIVQIEDERVGDKIEFAVAGTQLIRDENIVPVRNIAHQFSDIRVLFLLSNLNPDEPLADGRGWEDQGHPRFYFGRTRFDDVWFGEAQLLADRNLRRAALDGSVELSRLYGGLGASVEKVRGAMSRTRYTEVEDPLANLKPGNYRFLPEDDSLVEVYLKRNTYSWTMIGVSEDKKIYCLACKGKPGVEGYAIEQAAEQLLDINCGVKDALFIDGGRDVFQKVRLKPQNALEERIKIERHRLRAKFIFAK